MQYRIYVFSFFVLVLLYLGVIIGLPADPAMQQRYGLNPSQLKILSFTVAVPLTLIWFTAFYGFISFKKYADKVADTKEGNAFGYISIGLLLLTFSMPISSITSSLLNYTSSLYPHLVVPTTIFRNYLMVSLALITFLALFYGARTLTRTLGRRSYPDTPKGFMVGLIGLTAFYTWLIAYKPFNHGVDERVYFLPSWLLVFTIAVPYLIAWKAGMRATYYLYRYHESVQGIIYKSAFKDLARGIGVVIIVAILIQLITTSLAQLHRLNLTPVLLIVYGLLILYAVGFGLVARGAKKLNRLEEI